MIIFSGRGQYVPVHIHNNGIYEFLEEMADLKHCEINTVIKPWGRAFIAKKLQQVNTNRGQLNKRQKAELDFFLREFWKDMPTESMEENNDSEVEFFGFCPSRPVKWAKNKNKRRDMLFYGDSLFVFSANFIYGRQYWLRDDGESLFYRWNGGEAEAYVGEKWGFYGSLRDNYETELLAKPEYYTQRLGVPGKPDGYSEARGGITYSWKWGNAGFVKDHFEWGNNQHGANIFSGRTPSISHFRFNLYPAEWFEFNFVHGRLVSDVMDSTASYYTSGGTLRSVMHDKFISANMFTVRPFNWMGFSVGNSIIYSDKNYWGYLIPFYFFKSVDHTINAINSFQGKSGQNSQMFMDLSLRPVRSIHLYTSLFIDELSLARIKDPDRHNFESFKFGFSWSGIPVQNIRLKGEYTITSPMTYQHNIATTTFESNAYNLGYYLEDNSREYYLALLYKPVHRFHILLSYTLAQHGEDTDYLTYKPVDEHPWLENITWQQEALQLKLSWEAFHSGRFFADLSFMNTTGDVETHSPAFHHGKHLIASFGFGYGL